MQKQISIDELGKLFVRVVHLFNVLEKLPYFVEKDTFLYLSEIHMVDAIGRNDNINVTKLAKLLGVTKAAVSQMIRKLVKKGVVLKNISPETENEVVLQLTETGMKFFQYHLQYHQRLDEELAEIFAEMPEGTINRVAEVGEKMEERFSRMIEGKSIMLERS